MTGDGSERVDVRAATSADRLAVRRLLDGAVLAVDGLDQRLTDGEVLVATDDGTVCGTLVVATEGPADDRGAPTDDRGTPAAWQHAAHVRGIAVRRRRRDAGIGTALVRGATAAFGPLVADFDAGLRPFYESLDAALRPGAGDRWWALVAPED